MIRPDCGVGRSRNNRAQVAPLQSRHSRFHAKLRSDQSANVRRSDQGIPHSSGAVLEDTVGGLRELGRACDNGIVGGHSKSLWRECSKESVVVSGRVRDAENEKVRK